MSVYRKNISMRVRRKDNKSLFQSAKIKTNNLIHWQGDDWIIKQNRGYWSLCRPAVTVSWYLSFASIEEFVEFLEKEEVKHGN